METTCPVITANAPHPCLPLISTTPQPLRSLQWLLELEIDGTIRYSNIHPQGTLADGRNPVIGANFFELPEIGDLSAFKRDFVSFVKGDKNRQTFHLRTENRVYDGSTAIVLTRSFGTTEAGPSREVVLMELKRI
jgi:hypothetical protein